MDWKMDWRYVGSAIVILIILAVVLFINSIEEGYIVTCPKDTKVCPDGTVVARMGAACEFSVCPNPFTACLRKGYPILESYPRQCQFPDGTKVTEILD